MTRPPRGRFIALEGVDGCGKSTQARMLVDALGAHALLTFEPGATELGASLRQLLLDGDGAAPSARTEALLMAADRAEHVDRVVRPALEQGRIVVTDRFSGSTLAYQGFGRGLPIEDLKVLVAFAADCVEPDLNVLVDVPVRVARSRMQSAAPDRLERLDEAFFDRAREGYLTFAAADPDRWAVVDGDASCEEVAAAVREVVGARLGPDLGSRLP